MKFLADMGISPKTVAFLRDLGHDATHLAEQRLHRLPDPDIVSKARSEGRVILTHDLDFGTLMAVSGATLPSVIIFRLADMRPANVNTHLEFILRHHTNAIEAGAILSVSQDHVRVRRLPI